ncbi:Uncharacterized protein Fot_30008 [Forsythia ovata]|uniref:Uncharacterized protein n=1 Tax=Forsythia ovata TaxID=205694 RepID=A0ABD1TTI4_9LAMI
MQYTNGQIKKSSVQDCTMNEFSRLTGCDTVYVKPETWDMNSLNFSQVKMMAYKDSPEYEQHDPFYRLRSCTTAKNKAYIANNQRPTQNPNYDRFWWYRQIPTCRQH